MVKEENSYKQIVKTTSIYGTSQLVNIFLGIIRSKLTALLIGTVGMGMIGLFQSVIDLTRSASGFGLDTGATKQIAVSDANLPKTLFTVHIWYIFTAILGALLCVVFAEPLGLWVFGNLDYTKHISILSLAILFVTLYGGVISCLQGLRKISYMAIVSSLGSLLSLLIAMPIYYYWRLDGIILVFVLSNLIAFAVALFFYGKLKIKLEPISLKSVWAEGQGMVRLGIYIVLAGVMSAGSLFLVRSYISREDGVEVVGLFQSAWITAFLISGIVLRSANSDFFPKLCSLVDQKKNVRQFVNEQTHIILLIVSPLIIGLFTFGDYVIYLLYTSDFMTSTLTFRWHLVAIFLKMVSTPVATIILARNRGGLHLLCESVFWGVYLFSAYFLYCNFGLVGTGMAYLIAYLVYVPVVLLVSGRISNMMWSLSVWIILLVNVVLFGLLLFVSMFFDRYTLLLGSIILLLTSLYTYFQLRSLIGFDSLSSWMKRKIKK